MGSLRFLLAVSVAYGHAGAFLGFTLVPGDTAVQCFFIVSGFYMSLVLNGKYADAGYWVFISNRLLRLYPAYLAVMSATLALTTVRWPPVDRIGSLYFAVSQATIFGQDAEMFLAIKNGALAFTSNFNLTSPNLFEFAPIPQAWTLGIELWFYLLAPFILTRSVRVLIGIMVASLALRMILQFAFGLAGDPWSYRFFPSELALFMLGAVAHRANPKTLALMAVSVAAALLINRPNGWGRVASAAFLPIVAMAIPWLFARTKNIAMDKFLGELSYPIYLVHILVVMIVPNPVMAMCIILASATALHLFIEKPIDVWRQYRLVKDQSIAVRSAT